MASLPRFEVPTVDYGSEEQAMVRYRADGERRAMALGNRGPIQFDANGKLDPAILQAYSRCGFYVFEGVLKPDELADIERDVADMLARAPVTRGAAVDKQGRPALGVDCTAPNLSWVRPLSDPLGGTKFANGRHPAKMFEPAVPAEAPDYVVQLILGSLQFSDACLRVYGHPRTARRRGGGERRRLHAVQRGGVDQTGAPRRIGGVASGRLDALGKPCSWTKARTASTSWRSSMAVTPRTGCGWCRVRIASARPTSRRWWRRPVPIACRKRCR